MKPRAPSAGPADPPLGLRAAPAAVNVKPPLQAAGEGDREPEGVSATGRRAAIAKPPRRGRSRPLSGERAPRASLGRPSAPAAPPPLSTRTRLVGSFVRPAAASATVWPHPGPAAGEGGRARRGSRLREAGGAGEVPRTPPRAEPASCARSPRGEQPGRAVPPPPPRPRASPRAASAAASRAAERTVLPRPRASPEVPAPRRWGRRRFRRTAGLQVSGGGRLRAVPGREPGVRAGAWVSAGLSFGRSCTCAVGSDSLRGVSPDRRDGLGSPLTSEMASGVASLPAAHALEPSLVFSRNGVMSKVSSRASWRRNVRTGRSLPAPVISLLG